MSISLIVVTTALLVAAAFFDSECSFVLTRIDERNLETCLLRKKSESDQCFAARIIRRKHVKYCGDQLPEKGSTKRNELDFDSAKEYICALNEYKNTGHTQHDAADAVLDIGSCSDSYPYIARAWTRFFANRLADARMQLPSVQYRNGTTTTVAFISDNYLSRSSMGNLLAVDIVISRSNAEVSEVYGKYKLNVAIVGAFRQKSIVHESLQATCRTGERRFFVGGLNDAGLLAVSDWLDGQGNNIKFQVNVSPQKQIVNGESQARYRKLEFDIGASVSAMILHFNTSSDDNQVLLRRMLFPLSNRRIRRRASARGRHSRRRLHDHSTEDCHLASFVQSYRDNSKVIRPNEFDLGKCIGSCNGALTASNDARFNATNHALAMLQEIGRVPTEGNPTATVCCIPLSYSALYFVTMDERGIMMSVKQDNMIPQQCGCQ